MATKRKAQERVQNYPSLFPELGGEGLVSYGGEPQRSNKPRRRLNGYNVYNHKGKEETSLQKRNKKHWALLYPTLK